MTAPDLFRVYGLGLNTKLQTLNLSRLAGLSLGWNTWTSPVGLAVAGMVWKKGEHEEEGEGWSGDAVAVARSSDCKFLLVPPFAVCAHQPKSSNYQILNRVHLTATSSDCRFLLVLPTPSNLQTTKPSDRKPSDHQTLNFASSSWSPFCRLCIPIETKPSNHQTPNHQTIKP